MEDIDPDEAKNLIYVLENDVTDLELNFTIDTEMVGTIKNIELIPDGTNIIVNEENKK